MSPLLGVTIAVCHSSLDPLFFLLLTNHWLRNNFWTVPIGSLIFRRVELYSSGFSFGYVGWTTGFVFFGSPPPTIALDPLLDTIYCVYHHVVVGVPIAVLGRGECFFGTGQAGFTADLLLYPAP
jgi:hypothetical protein